MASTGETSVLPDGWRDRLVEVRNTNIPAPAGEPRLNGCRLDKTDLCVAKLAAVREKDGNFVAALLEAKLVNADLIASRLPTVPGEHIAPVYRALHRLNSMH